MDKTDLKIIGLLATDSRLSYERIGSTLNLTRNSIKTRIKKMISKGVIQEYIADVNFTTLGYRICYIVTKQEVKNGNKTKVSNNSNSNRRKTVIEYLNRIGDILAEIEVLGGSSIFRIATEAFSYKETRLKGYDNIGSSLPTGIIDKVF
ncbi:MAG: AsnC family transcriptional regulator [Nitrososphaeraceae archaeon]